MRLTLVRGRAYRQWMTRTAHLGTPHRVGAFSLPCSLALVMAIAGCGGSSAQGSAAPVGQLGAVDDGRDGRTPETAWHACSDTRSDYQRVAAYRCADGSMPLGGDARAGGAARRGNIGEGPDGHILDLYDVPCPEGAVQIYVDMYHCDDEQGPLSEAEIEQALSDVRRYAHSPEDMSSSVVMRGMRVAEQLGITFPECRHVAEMVIPTETELADWRFIGTIYYAAQLVGLVELRSYYANGADPALLRPMQMEKVRAAALQVVETYRRLVMAGYGDLRNTRLDSLAAMSQAEFNEALDLNSSMCNLEVMMPGMRLERGAPAP